jgi:hypothetical protein
LKRQGQRVWRDFGAFVHATYLRTTIISLIAFTRSEITAQMVGRRFELQMSE